MIKLWYNACLVSVSRSHNFLPLSSVKVWSHHLIISSISQSHRSQVRTSNSRERYHVSSISTLRGCRAKHLLIPSPLVVAKQALSIIIVYAYPRWLNVSRTLFFKNCLGVVFFTQFTFSERGQLAKIEENFGLCFVLTCIQTPCFCYTLILAIVSS